MKRHLLAQVTALILWLISYKLYTNGLLRLDLDGFITLAALFWLVNLVFFVVMGSGLNNRFTDPSLTMPQILWATVSVMVMAYLLRESRHVVLMIYFLVMVFGAFRLRIGQFFVVTLVASTGYASVILGLLQFHPGSLDLRIELINWFVFTIVMVCFSILGGELSQLRTTLRHRNRELETARDAANAGSKAKSEFLATVSHELRTPLNSILGMSEALKDSGLSRDQARYVESAQRSGGHLLSLINSMLDMSRLDDGGVVLNAEQFELVEAVKMTCEAFDASVKESGLDLDLNISDDVPARVIGDEARLREILTNLISNAIKFTDAGKVTIDVGRAEEERLKDLVVFAVTDTGVGISKSVQDEIFGPFFQGDGSITRQFGGTGLGLAICRHLVGKMGGEIWLESTSGSGTTFWFTARFPAIDVDDKSPSRGSPGATAGGGRPPDAPVRVLLVDDAVDNRLLVKAYLKGLPCVIDEAETGSVAVEKFKNAKFDLVLMDIHMPEMDGLSATRAIRQWESRHEIEATPILALTADTMSHDRSEILQAGCTDHLVKPISKSGLRSALSPYFSARESSA